MIQDIPIEHIAVGEEIIAEAKRRLDKKLNDTLYISLIDHVHTSIVRFLEGVTVKNVLLWDIRRFYKEEFRVGLWALDLIQEKCKVRLPEDEAGFIALHLANGQMDQESMHNMYEITRIIQEVVNIVKYFFKIDFDEEDVYYFRFITHLKFFAQRLWNAGFMKRMRWRICGELSGKNIRKRTTAWKRSQSLSNRNTIICFPKRSSFI